MAADLSEAQIDHMVRSELMPRVEAARAQVVPAQEAVYRATLQLEAAQEAVPPHPATVAAATQRLEEAKEIATQVYKQYDNTVFNLKKWRHGLRGAFPHDLEYESGRLAGLPSEATRNAVQYMKNVRGQPGGRLHMPSLQALQGMSARDFNDYTEKMANRLHKISDANRKVAHEAAYGPLPEPVVDESYLQPGLGGASMRRMKVKRTRGKKRHASTRKHSKKYAYSRKRIHRRKY